MLHENLKEKDLVSGLATASLTSTEEPVIVAEQPIEQVSFVPKEEEQAER